MSIINLGELSRLDLNLAVTFLVLWEERSVSKAATRVSLSQSAVSASLARLRALTGDPLFVRTQGGMEPTPRALAMAEGIKRGVELLNQALIMEEGFEPATSNRHFSMGMSDDFEVAIGPEISRRLLAMAPGITIVFRQSNRHTVLQMLESREIDLAVAAGAPARASVIAEEIGQSGYASLLDNDICQLELPLSLQDFLELPHILTSFSGREGIVDTALRSIGQRRTIHTALTHFSILPAYLHTMRAITTLPSHAAAALAANSSLSVSKVPIDLGTYAVSTLCRRDVNADPALQWLKAIVREAFQVCLAIDQS